MDRPHLAADAADEGVDVKRLDQPVLRGVDNDERQLQLLQRRPHLQMAQRAEAQLDATLQRDGVVHSRVQVQRQRRGRLGQIRR